MTLPLDVARHVLLAYCGLAILAARGFHLRAAAGAEAALAGWWAPTFAVVALLLALAAVWPRSALLVVSSGVLLHLLLVGRVWAGWVNPTTQNVPGASMVSTALLGVVILSSALTWRYLLWPSTRRA